MTLFSTFIAITAIVFVSGTANAASPQEYGPSHNNYRAGASSYGASHNNYHGTPVYTSPGAQHYTGAEDYVSHSANHYGPSTNQAYLTSVPY